jgi:hypothetical protein
VNGAARQPTLAEASELCDGHGLVGLRRRLAFRLAGRRATAQQGERDEKHDVSTHGRSF